ncbi:hypothetical protein G9A89_001137 [Geosiphon pyriformis]|nr:hypothetical protein G9A89_001137 [Geosiphon pyriformis]
MANISSQNYQKIILNIGGTQFETLRSTLIAHPNTLLGKMFLEDGEESHQADGHEYFFDRDGETFHYIMRFYREGRITWFQEHCFDAENTCNLSRLLQEMRCFKIGTSALYKPVDMVNQWAADLHNFALMLKHAVETMIANHEDNLQLLFYQSKEAAVIGDIAEIFEEWVNEFSYAGYHILDLFGDDIRKNMEAAIPNLMWKLTKEEHHPPSRSYTLNLDFPFIINKNKVLEAAGLINW